MSKLLPSKRRKTFRQSDATNSGPQNEAEKSAWDHYNEKAKIEDIELVKDWYETLSNLLIFAALFSAILTAFVIESMRLLQEDTQQSTRDILLFMTVQAVNASMPNATVLPYINEPFHLEGYVIAMNCMFFASLSLSLLAALASIIILQWVGKYDAGIMSFPTAKERALHRQFRLDGVRTWRMEDMIGALPYLLYFSLVFFFIGAIIWLHQLNTIVMAVIVAFFVVGVLVYTATTLLAVKFPSAPFRTPLSDYITSFLFTNPTHRENTAVKSDDSFELGTLLRYLGTLEVVPHSYNVISTTVRLIMQQPFNQLSRPDGVVTETRWKSIFEIILSTYRESREELRKETDNLMFRSLADYTISLSVQEAPEHRGLVKDLLGQFPIFPEYHPVLKFNNIDLSDLESYNPEKTSSGFLYGTIRRLPSLVEFSVETSVLLNWLSKAISVSSDELDTALLLPSTLLKPLLTTAASAICRMCRREDQISEDISSISEFVGVVSPGLEVWEAWSQENEAIHSFLAHLFIYLCSRLSRPNDHSISMDILEDISALFNPEIHGRFHHVRLFELLDAFSKCSISVQTSGKSTIYQAFDLYASKDNTISAPLRRLFSLNHFLWQSSKAWSYKKKLISSFIYDSSLFEPYKFSDAELEHARTIDDPALRLIAAFNSDNLLDLDSARNVFSENDPLLQISASNWIARKLWSPNMKPLSSGELSLLEQLLTICFTDISDSLAVGLVSFTIRDNSGPSMLLPLNPSDYFTSFANFDAFVLSCQPSSFVRLLIVLDYWWFGRIGSIKPHLIESMREEVVAKKVLSLVETIWDDIPVEAGILTPCFQGFCKNQDPLFLQSCCILALSMQETGLLTNYDIVKPLITQLHSMAEPAAFLPVMEALSKIISRQETLRLQYATLEAGSPKSLHVSLPTSSRYSSGESSGIDENSLVDWISDLGSRRWIAFESLPIWTAWLEWMKALLAQQSS